MSKRYGSLQLLLIKVGTMKTTQLRKLQWKCKFEEIKSLEATVCCFVGNAIYSKDWNAKGKMFKHLLETW